MVKISSEIPNYVWDCRSIEVPHSPSLEHDRGMEDGLPNFWAQQHGDVRVTICKSCHPRIPGHIITTEPENIEQYFEIKHTADLMEALPSGYSATGGSAKIREKIMRACVQDRYNPYKGHAGKTLKISLAYQWDRKQWEPRDSELPSDPFNIEAYREAYSDES